MEQVLFRLHVRFSRAFCYVFNPLSRRYLEVLSLFNACLCLLVLITLHTTFLRPRDSNNCIYQALYDPSTGGIDLNFDVLEISYAPSNLPNYLCLFNDDKKENDVMHVETNDGRNVDTNRNTNENTWSWIKKNICISKTPTQIMAKEFWFSLDKGKIMLNSKLRDKHHFVTRNIHLSKDDKCFGNKYTSWLVHSIVGYETVTINWVISQFDGKGFLLNLKSKEMFNLYYSSHRFNPFGNQTREFSTKDNHVKWDTGDESYDNDDVDLASIKGRSNIDTTANSCSVDNSAENCKTSTISSLSISVMQQVFHWLDESHIPVQYKYDTYIQLLSSKVSLFLTACFLFFASTTLVHFTLRETQEKMLKFTFLLQYHIRNQIPYASLIFWHLIESIVFVPVFLGLLFFIGEFFNDRVLAFMLISLVWLSEVYCVIVLRTSPSLQFFPKFFFFFFSIFIFYFYSFPFGFSHISFLCVVLFVQHSMLFFWNRYELPALQSGYINPLRPRFFLATAEDLRTQINGRVSYRNQEEEEGHAVVSGAGNDGRVVSILDDTFEFEQSVDLSRRIQQQELSSVFGVSSYPSHRNNRNRRGDNNAIESPRNNNNLHPINMLQPSSVRNRSIRNHDYLGPQGNERRIDFSRSPVSNNQMIGGRRRTFTAPTPSSLETSVFPRCGSASSSPSSAYAGAARSRFGSGGNSHEIHSRFDALNELRFPDINIPRRINTTGNMNSNIFDGSISRCNNAIPLRSMVGGTLFDKEDADAADDASRRMLVS